MPVKIRSSSRLLFGRVVVLDEVEHWDTLVLPENRPRADDIVHVVASSDRIDLLAQSYYGDPVLWWVIAWANDLDVIPTDLKVNSEIRIPSLSFIDRKLFTQARIQR